MGAMFIGQQFLQNVLGYSTLEAGAGDPAGGGVHGARRAALGQARRGARRPLHAARRLRLLPARLPHDAAALEGGHLLLEGRARLRAHRDRRRVRRHAGLALAHRLGAGRRAPAWRRAPPTSSATSAARSCSRSSARCSPPATPRPSAAAIAASPNSDRSPTASQSQLTKSFASAESVAAQYPQYASQITSAAKTSFLDGDQWAYTAGIVAVLLGAALVFFLFPKHEDEEQLLARYHAEDTARAGEPAEKPGPQEAPATA